MNINQYAPKQIYDDINSTLDNLKKQSDILHTVIKNLDLKCINYQFISESEIDDTINSIRNYFLIKEDCLEKSQKILTLNDTLSIEDLHSQIKEHQDNSLAIANEVLYYAYEFLKIKSSNIITDGLLQDHREKLNAIITSMLNEFVNVEEVIKQLEPYKIALLYITKQLSDLTPYAELINNTFGAILFYNIISGNNIEYDFTSNVTENIPNDTDISKKLDEFSTDSTEIEEETQATVLDEFEPEPIMPLEEQPLKEDINSTETLEEDIQLEIISSSEEVNTEEEISQEVEVEEETPVQAQEIEEDTHTITEEENILNSNEEPIENTQQEEPSKEEVSSLEQEEHENDIENIMYQDSSKYFEDLAKSINEKYLDTNSIQYDNKSFSEEIVLDEVYDYILLKQFACASMVLKEYSQLSSNIDSLYIQYGVALGDPCVNCDYSVAFIPIVDERIHSWLELSALLREMFTCKNKEIECYNFIPYINSLVQNNSTTIMPYISNFSDILDIFNEIDYNTNYIIGIKLFDEKSTITSQIKQQAYEMLLYCEKTICLWNNHKTLVSATRNMFSSNGGDIYNLIKEINIGNFDIIPEIKKFCSRFADENGHILDSIHLNKKIEEYLHEQLILAVSKRGTNINPNDTDVNIGYRTKFINRFTTILNFLFSCVDKMNDFNVNYINQSNVEKYRKLKDTLIDLLNNNCNELSKKASNKDIPKLDRVGMICLSKTFKDIISYIDCKNYNQNYFYCELLKTGYFLLDEMYIPYINKDISNINGFEVSTRVKKHLSDIKYINSWEDAINNNIKKFNYGNFRLISLYLKNTNQSLEFVPDYYEVINNVNYSLEDTYQKFKLEIDTLYLNEAIPNRSIYNLISQMESIVRNIVSDNNNYGFYENFLSCLKSYAIKIAEDSYSNKNDIVNLLGSTLGYDSDYYTSITSNMDNHNYSVSDELINMYFNDVEYPNNVIDNSQLQQYDEIYSNFMSFCDEYSTDLSSPNGYIFMNEFYNNTIKSIVLERFKGSYDCVKSDELIDTWVKGQSNNNVIYDILTNIGFSIESVEELDTHHSHIVLSNSERNSSQPYTIPENVVFLNGIYNVSQAERHINNLKILEDTLIILDYALDRETREHILKNLSNISNNNRVVLIDRCVIMFLTITPSNLRKLACKVCGICNISNNIAYSPNFRIDYIQDFIKDRKYNFLLGRKYFGKTSVLNGIVKGLQANPDNIVLSIDAIDNTLANVDLISKECQELALKINPFNDWNSFEASMTRYINKHPNKKLVLLIDNGDRYIQNCLEDNQVVSINILKNLLLKFKDRFSFIISLDMCNEYVSYLEKINLPYSVLRPLSYNEVANMFRCYLNGSRISINDDDVMNILVSKTFGCPEVVKVISKEISLAVTHEDDIFKGNYMYNLTLDIVNKAISNECFLDKIIPTFLSTVLGSKTNNSSILPVIYAIIYFLHEHSSSTFTIEDINGVLSIFDLMENSTFDIKTSLEELQTLNIVCKLKDEEKYFLSHDIYMDYLGNKEFAFDTLDYCTKIFAKEGIAQ